LVHLSAAGDESFVASGQIPTSSNRPRVSVEPKGLKGFPLFREWVMECVTRGAGYPSQELWSAAGNWL